LRGANVHDFPNQRAIRDAFVLLLGGFAEPAILGEREANDVHAPILDHGAHGRNDVPLTIARPFQAGGVNATEKQWLILTVRILFSTTLRGSGILASSAARELTAKPAAVDAATTNTTTLWNPRDHRLEVGFGFIISSMCPHDSWRGVSLAMRPKSNASESCWKQTSA